MTGKIISFIMSGGIGSRLWPLSREDFPKQFHDFSGHGSMLSQTVSRLNHHRDTPIYLIGSEAHASRLGQDIAGLPLNGGRPIFEPIGRNTAAAVALASQIALNEQGEDALVLVVPSDHEISTNDDFWTTINEGKLAAKNGKIVVFGIAPDKPETGYGYIETAKDNNKALGNHVFDVERFVEKPDLETAQNYFASGNFLWNSGIFLFSAKTMQESFLKLSADIWHKTAKALNAAKTDISGTWLPFDDYADIPSTSVDYAIMEHADNIALVRAKFHWNDLGSWQSLLDAQGENNNRDEFGNVIIGDVVAIDCERSYLRSQGGLLSAVGLRNMAVVATSDATFVAPVSQSQNVREVVAALEKSGRLEAKFTPAPDRMPIAGSYNARVEHWLFDETLPLWSTRGVDDKGGFYEALGLDGLPIIGERRMRTMARQIYAFAIAGEMGWDGPAQQLIDHGLDFIFKHGQTENGGWASSFDANGEILNPVEDLYDQAFVLLALAHAHKAGHKKALPAAINSFAFLDEHLSDKSGKGFFETPNGERQWRRSNPHMHLLETFLAWYDVTGNIDYLQRASRIVDLFKSHFFDRDSWTLGEFFDDEWRIATGEPGDICEPGHHFEWASLLISFQNLCAKAKKSCENLVPFARKLYAFGIANGLNRATGLAYNSVSRSGLPIDRNSRSWPQTEVIKAAIALDGNQGPDLKPEIEARVGRLFRWHIDAAPKGLWIDMIDEDGRGRSNQVPASIFYHLVCALTQYRSFAQQINPKHNS